MSSTPQGGNSRPYRFVDVDARWTIEPPTADACDDYDDTPSPDEQRIAGNFVPPEPPTIAQPPQPPAGWELPPGPAQQEQPVIAPLPSLPALLPLPPVPPPALAHRSNGNSSERPTALRQGQSLDAFLAAQRLTEVLQPIGSLDLDLLFHCFCQFPAFFAEARRILRDYHFDPSSELQYGMMYRAMCAVADRHGNPNNETLMIEIMQHLSAMGGALLPEFVDSIIRQDGQGLVWMATNIPADQTSLSYGRDTLKKFLHERTVVHPLRRMLAQGVNGTYPAAMPEFLDLVGEQSARNAAIASGRPDKRRPLTTAELDARADNITDIIPGVATAGQIYIIGGPTKTLKTLIALAFQFSLITRTPLLGNPAWTPTVARRPWIITRESGPRTLRRKRQVMVDAAVARVLGREAQQAERERIERAMAENVRWTTEWLPNITDASDLRYLAQTIRDGGFTDLLLDPLFGCLGGLDTAKTSEVTATIERLHEVVLDAGADLWLDHHTAGDRQRKQTVAKYQPIELADLAIPGVTNTVGAWCAVNRAEKYDHINRKSVLWAEFGSRDLGEGGMYKLTIVEGAHHDHWDVTLTPEVEYIAVATGERDNRQAALQREREQKVLAAMKERAAELGPPSVKQLAKQIEGMSEDTVGPALQRLTGRGVNQIKSAERGRIVIRYELSDHPMAVGGIGGGIG